MTAAEELIHLRQENQLLREQATLQQERITLLFQQLLPLARACEILSDLLSVSMSEGTPSDLIRRCAGLLAAVESQIKKAPISTAAIHQDETGLYVAGQRHLLHVTCTPILTYYSDNLSSSYNNLKLL